MLANQTSRQMMQPVTCQRGQSMIEVLVSVVIFSVGILGAMSLQTTSLSLNQSSYYRAQAMISASDIIERMRANEMGVVDGYYDGYSSGSPPSNPGCSAGSYCDEAAWAQYDLYEWSGNFSNTLGEESFKPLLPAGSAEINYDEVNDEYLIVVSWNEVDWNSDGSGTRIDQTKSISMRVAI